MRLHPIAFGVLVAVLGAGALVGAQQLRRADHAGAQPVATRVATSPPASATPTTAPPAAVTAAQAEQVCSAFLRATQSRVWTFPDHSASWLETWGTPLVSRAFAAPIPAGDVIRHEVRIAAVTAAYTTPGPAGSVVVAAATSVPSALPAYVPAWRANWSCTVIPTAAGPRVSALRLVP